eukprot:140516-Chlamydomonas_euryale.AAC.3
MFGVKCRPGSSLGVSRKHCGVSGRHALSTSCVKTCAGGGGTRGGGRNARRGRHKEGRRKGGGRQGGGLQGRWKTWMEITKEVEDKEA